ncbi:unnamed protein product [Cuscuta europaea]|uniref:Retroviral polymerase SH3-like domain-containing protein n=1 Tax=Cuscuta europaea TaxID=41803 RepID=A0A9P1E462_CUSEU|nr:unnamed protein product [Cuscuta europaea]
MSPSVPLGGKCPEFVFTGEPLALTSLRVFGCATYVNHENGESEPKTKEFVFLGYNECIKGYRLWCRSEACFNVLSSRNVIFVEMNFLACLFLLMLLQMRWSICLLKFILIYLLKPNSNL